MCVCVCVCVWWGRGEGGRGQRPVFFIIKKQKENALNSEIKQRNWFLL